MFALLDVGHPSLEPHAHAAPLVFRQIQPIARPRRLPRRLVQAHPQTEIRRHRTLEKIPRHVFGRSVFGMHWTEIRTYRAGMHMVVLLGVLAYALVT